MISVTIREARARLNDLVEKAIAGEEVVILKGSKHVATLVPITSADLELVPRLSDAQAGRFWTKLARDRDAGHLASFDSPEAAVSALKRRQRARPRK